MIPNNLLKNPWLVWLVGYSFVLLCAPGESKLSILKECGELICKEDQYCSKVDHSCRNCGDACNSQHNNYDLSVCEKDCQDFLHDLLYKRKPTEVDSMDEIQIMTLHKQSLEEDLHTITLLLGFVLISLAFMFIMISIILVFLLKHRRQFGDDTSKTVVNEFPIIYNKHCQKEDSFSIPLETKNDKAVRETESKILRSPSNASKAYESSISQKSIAGDKLRREPSESTLPEYVYDNPTLVPSPTHHM